MEPYQLCSSSLERFLPQPEFRDSWWDKKFQQKKIHPYVDLQLCSRSTFGSLALLMQSDVDDMMLLEMFVGAVSDFFFFRRGCGNCVCQTVKVEMAAASVAI